MNKQIAIELDSFVSEIASRFSRTDREGNVNNETFTVQEVIPTSNHSAVCVFEKNTGKRAVAFLYYIPRGMSSGWKYFFPTDSHINGFRAFELYKFETERHNYKKNFL